MLVSLSGLPFFIMYIKDGFWIKICLFDHKFVALPDGKNILILMDFVHLLCQQAMFTSAVTIYILFSISTANDGKLTTPCGRPELGILNFLHMACFPKHKFWKAVKALEFGRPDPITLKSLFYASLSP